MTPFSDIMQVGWDSRLRPQPHEHHSHSRVGLQVTEPGHDHLHRDPLDIEGAMGDVEHWLSTRHLLAQHTIAVFEQLVA